MDEILKAFNVIPRISIGLGAIVLLYVIGGGGGGELSQLISPSFLAWLEKEHSAAVFVTIGLFVVFVSAIGVAFLDGIGWVVDAGVESAFAAFKIHRPHYSSVSVAISRILKTRLNYLLQHWELVTRSLPAAQPDDRIATMRKLLSDYLVAAPDGEFLQAENYMMQTPAERRAIGATQDEAKDFSRWVAIFFLSGIAVAVMDSSFMVRTTLAASCLAIAVGCYAATQRRRYRAAAVVLFGIVQSKMIGEQVNTSYDASQD